MREWRDILKHPGYQVSDDGYLRSLPDIDERVRATCVTTGAVSVFDSGQEAARELGIDGSGVSQAARGTLRTYKGYQWVYL
jgi:hypothetical protein